MPMLQVKRPGHESEIAERSLGVELLGKVADAAIERFALSEEVIEVLFDRDVGGLMYRQRSPGRRTRR